jgi:hypothetical protein
MTPFIYLPPKKRVKKGSTDQKIKPFEPPMNTDEHRLKADKEKRIHTKIAFVFFMLLSVFIGVHRWLKNSFDHLTSAISVDASLCFCDALSAGDPVGVAMTQSIDRPPRNLMRERATDKGKKLFEPPMNTDEHRLKADKEKGLLTELAFVFFMFLSVFIGVHRWLKNSFNLLNPIVSVDASLGVCDASVCG